MRNKKDCSKCYIEIKKWHIIRGILYVIVMTIGLMIPVLNIYILEMTFNYAKENPKSGLWDDVFYDYVKYKINKINKR